MEKIEGRCLQKGPRGAMKQAIAGNYRPRRRYRDEAACLEAAMKVEGTASWLM